MKYDVVGGLAHDEEKDRCREWWRVLRFIKPAKILRTQIIGRIGGGIILQARSSRTRERATWDSRVLW